jgi:hypothetical protein
MWASLIHCFEPRLSHWKNKLFNALQIANN